MTLWDWIPQAASILGITCMEAEEHTVTELEIMIATHRKTEATKLRQLLAIVQAGACSAMGGKGSARAAQKLDRELAKQLDL